MINPSEEAGSDSDFTNANSVSETPASSQTTPMRSRGDIGHIDLHGISRSTWRTLTCVVAMVFLFEFCIYQTHDYFGPATFLLLSPLLMLVGLPSLGFRKTAALLLVMIGISAVRLAWCGNWLSLFVGVCSLVAYSVAVRSEPVYLLNVVIQFFETIPGAATTFNAWERSVRLVARGSTQQASRNWMVNWILPTMVGGLFAVVFVLANADVVVIVEHRLSDLLDGLAVLFEDFSFLQAFGWLAMAVVAAGFCRPLNRITRVKTDLKQIPESAAPLYDAWRNTLLTVCVIFAVYLTFESRAFFRSEPPEGFTFSSYAHEGAAWLTVALGLSTLTLSLIFRGAMFSDPRCARLERLAWVWIVLNGFLAVAALNRMGIYIAHNGMTRMRVIGLFGITAVVMGLAVVLLKIRWKSDFRWLVRRQSWIAAGLIWLYSVLPVDVLVNRYNVAQIYAGNVAPIVQVTAHTISDECLPVLLPLCEMDDVAPPESNSLALSLVRAGIRDYLQMRYSVLQKQQSAAESGHWTRNQWFRNSVLAELDRTRSVWRGNEPRRPTLDAWKTLQKQAYDLYW